MWDHAIVGEQIGLQHLGPHPRSNSSLPQFFTNLCRHDIGTMQSQLDVALHFHSHYGSSFAPLPNDIVDPSTTIFVPRSLVFRLSKWTDFAGAGETDARKLVRGLFRKGKELGTIPRRFLDQHDHLIGNVLQDYRSWAEAVIGAWGGIPSSDPRIVAALSRL